ncbi:helix-turn-helix domain-containing protein [Ureibacillus xyleni]|uniref:helix-turn-helix domain-containing protein n=1 Tax=Ureibacillus xyleni TaxID=614648 RepID=UPI00137B735C|nr:helix-turn-helix transcriptional regulator [Ureibacillus xyleni]
MTELYNEELFIDNFAKEIRRKRKEKSLSLNELEEITGISASLIARIENKQSKNLGITVSFKLSNILKINILQIIEASKQK